MEETPKTFEDKPIVQICAYCQQINAPNMVEFSHGIDQKVKDEMKIVDAQIQKPENKQKYSFTHGTCKPHHIQNIQSIPNITPEKAKIFIDKINASPDTTPCLIQNDALRHAFMKGLFTIEDMQRVKQSNQQITERFKKLAGIQF
jgi:hypothetical protein